MSYKHLHHPVAESKMIPRSLERQFHFSVLFSTDISRFLPQCLSLFNSSELTLFRQIIDIGFGSVYQHITPSLHANLIDILPFKIKHCIKQIKHNRSLQFISFRQKLFVLSNLEFTQFLCQLSSLCVQINHNLFGKIIHYGFNEYRTKNVSTSVISHKIIHFLCNKLTIPRRLVVENRNNAYLALCGYCRPFRIPFDVMHLCYYYYFMLYQAASKNDISDEFGSKYATHNEHFMIWNGITVTPCDEWDVSLTNHNLQITANATQIQRVTPPQIIHGIRVVFYNAFGSEVVSFGTRKVWNVLVQPKIANLMVGVVCCEDKHGSRKPDSKRYLRYNKKVFAYNGFAYLPYSGQGFYGGFGFKQITDRQYIDASDATDTVIGIVLDMTRLQCKLEFKINGHTVGGFNEEINALKSYKLAVSTPHPQ
eukprot:224152_1